jgi:hypothetical protein
MIQPVPSVAYYEPVVETVLMRLELSACSYIAAHTFIAKNTVLTSRKCSFSALIEGGCTVTTVTLRDC